MYGTTYPVMQCGSVSHNKLVKDLYYDHMV
jgi:hypothetical protein